MRPNRSRLAFEKLETRNLLTAGLTMVRYFDTWDSGIIRSTDVAGITYHAPSGHLYLADSEINEMSEFVGDNIFEASLLGDQSLQQIASNNTEPTGITYNEFDGYFYLVNDSTRTLNRYDHNLNNILASVLTTDATPDAEDPEGVASDPFTGDLYVVDGALGGKQVLVYDSNMLFQYSFPTPQMKDGEGIALDPFSRHLFIVSAKDDALFEYTVDGVFIREYDLSDLPVDPDEPQGLTFAPTSDPNDAPQATALYIADGMEDNFADGRVFEVVLVGQQAPENRSPNVNAGPDQSVFVGNFATDLATLNGMVTDDSLPAPPVVTTQWTKVSGPGSVTFGDAALVDTTAKFDQPGIFVLRLAASDGALVASDDLTIVVHQTAGTTNIAIPIQAGTDDAEQSKSGPMNLTSSDLDLGRKITGLRFAGVEIPPESTIVDAYIQFQADEAAVAAASFTIAGEATDNSATFTSVPFNITSRSTTSASVAWSPTAWSVGSAGLNQRSPNVASIIQEIVSRPGWENGGALSLIVSGTGKREAESLEGKGPGPVLQIRFVDGTLPNQPPSTNAGVDHGVTLPNLASLDGTVVDDGRPGPFTATWSKVSGPGAVTFADLHAVDTTAAFAVAGAYVLRLTATDGELTSADEVHVTVANPGPNQPPVVNAGADQSVSLPGISTLDATVTDDGQAGPVATTWSKLSGPGSVTFGDVSAMDTTAEFSQDGTYVLRLTADDGELTSTDDIVITVVDPNAQVRQFETSVSASSDDAEEESASASVDLLSSDLDLGTRTIGLRFDNLDVYSGATILNAYIQFQADETGGASTQLGLTGEATDNSTTFNSSPANVTSRATTDASVSWSIPAWLAGEVGVNQRTPNISSIIQEIVSRPGWTSGNALSIIVSGSGKRGVESFEGSGAAPRLHIEFRGGTQPANQAPQVDAGGDQSVVLPSSIVVNGTVSDDGQPGPVTTTWSQVSGPGIVTFANANAIDTLAGFSQSGIYVLRLTASDTELVTTDDVTVTVLEGTTQVTVFEASVSASSDDAEETKSGRMSLTSRDLDFGSRIVGLRFANVEVFPGATIVDAYIQFQADETDSGATQLSLVGEAADDSATFSMAPFDVSSRPQTSTSVAWSPLAWNAGDKAWLQRSPDISGIIQEITSRPGWTSGAALSVVITGSGQRTAEPFEGSTAPRLHIEFAGGSLPPNSAPSVDAGADQSVVIPNHAALNATVTDDGQPAPFATTWSQVSGPGTVAFGDANAVDTTAQFSAAGTYVLRLTANDGQLQSVDDTTVTVFGGGIPIASINAAVTASSDDVEETKKGVMDLPSSDLDFGKRTIGLRFNGVDVDPSATIVGAYIQFQADESGTNDTQLSLAGEATDDSVTFNSTPFNVTSRPQTSAAVDWTVPTWNVGEKGLNQRTPDISSIIQEIVSRPGWTSGSALSIILSGTGRRAAEPFDGKGTAPQLYIEYMSGSPLRFDSADPGTDEQLNSLTVERLQPVVNEAIARWSSSGLDDSQLAQIQTVNFVVTDLDPYHYLGLATNDRVLIDNDGAGYGWFVDVAHSCDAGLSLATGNCLPSRQHDLLSVVMHELGHVLGYDDLDPALHPMDLMAATIGPGTRRLESTQAFALLHDVQATKGHFTELTVLQRPTAQHVESKRLAVNENSQPASVIASDSWLRAGSRGTESHLQRISRSTSSSMSSTKIDETVADQVFAQFEL